MVPRTSATGAPHPEAVEFVRFCYHRRRVGWPELYDEMCAVAGRGLFHGFSADDLGGIGVGFSLFDMPALATLASRVVAEEAALRRPARVVIAGAAVAADVPPATDRSLVSPAASAESMTAAAGPAPIAPALAAPTAAAPTAAAPNPSPARSAAASSDERSFDVPVRLVLAPSGT